jgi:hypothetical protein
LEGTKGEPLYLEMMREEPNLPAHAPNPYFVTCFSEEEDDLVQWKCYGDGGIGYAIGFRAATLFGASSSMLVRVNYDKALHERIAAKVAEATVQFFSEGLKNERAATPGEWETEFLVVWDGLISKLAPMVKDPSFKNENEYRVVHELVVDEIPEMKFMQRKTMMSRHLPLRFPLGGGMVRCKLPIAKVLVGPCPHREITRISVDTLLRKMGYVGVPVYSSARPLQQL